MRQILNLFLALLLSAFSSENMKKGQQQDADGIDDDEEEARTSDDQLTAAGERVRRWVKFVAVRVDELTRRRASVTDADVSGGALKATSTADTACDLTNAVSPDGTPACRRSSPQPAVLVDCSDIQV